MKLFRTTQGIVVEHNGAHVGLSSNDFDALLRVDDLHAHLHAAIDEGEPLDAPPDMDADLLAPVVSQAVWAAGVTYYRSRDARMEESAAAGGGSFYDRVYDAPRPELFMKATPHRVVGHRGKVRIRQDSRWNVPEPELALCVNARGRIVGYTVGNDMSSRDIEGENPLYLPQAKVYDQSAALGPGVLITNDPLPPETTIALAITRDGKTVFAGDTQIAQIKRPLQSLVDYLYRDNSFPQGCFLMTGTGVIPDNDFTLEPGDEVSITIDHVGTLSNTVVRGTTAPVNRNAKRTATP
mgnify:CR=1 FL=1